MRIFFRILFFSILIGVVIIIGSGVAWWASQTPTYVRSFRLAIEVEVDGAPRIGSSVINVRTTDYKAGFAETKGVRSQVFGEAVFLDLGRGRNVIATLGFNPGGRQHMIELLDFRVFRAMKPNLQIEDLPQLTGNAPLTGDFIPTLVTFSDLNDPKTARVVKPEEFEQVFGPDVHFRRAWIEMTGDPVTRGIEKKLPWLNRPGRPASEAYHAWTKGQKFGTSIEPEILFKRG